MYNRNELIQKLQETSSNKLTKETCLASVRQTGQALQHIPQDKFNDNDYKEMCFEAVRNDGQALEHVPKDKFNYDDYKAICLAAISKDGQALEHVPEDKFNDNDYKNMCIEAVKKDGLALQYVPKDKFNDNDYRNMYIEAVRKEVWALLYVQKDKFGDNDNDYKEMCLTAVRKDGNLLKYVPKDKFNDNDYKEMCLVAISKDGLALQHVPKDKFNDSDYKEMCLAAVRKDGHALQYVPKDKFNNNDYKEICLEAVRRNRLAFRYIQQDKFDNNDNDYKEMCLAAVREYGQLLKYVYRDKFNDNDYKEMCLEAVRKNGMALEYVKYFVRPDNKYESESESESNSGEIIDIDEIELKNYKEICLEAVKQDGMALRYILTSELSKEDYKEICLEAVRQDGWALEYVVPRELNNQKDYKEIYLEAVKQDKRASRYIYDDSFSFFGSPKNKPQDLDNKFQELKYNINFMWINSQRDEKGEYIYKRSDTENLDYVLNQLEKWAKANPEATINFWFDSTLTNPTAIKNTQEKLNKISDKIQLKDIRDIPFVQDNTDFFLPSIPVYFRVDLLKMIVCLYGMENDGMDSTIFSDFSIGDKVDKAPSKEVLYDRKMCEILEQLGIVMGDDGFKPENQFLQTLNTPELINSLKHAINCTLYMAANVLNWGLKENNLEYLSHLDGIPFAATMRYIPLYFHALKTQEPIKIRSDIVNEGTKDKWVDYDSEKHNYILFGNYCDTKTISNQSYIFKPETQETIKDFTQLPKNKYYGGNHNESMYNRKLGERGGVRKDLNPGRMGRTHTWEQEIRPEPIENKEFEPSFWPLKSVKPTMVIK
jgi:hypothetical protein